MCGCFPLYSPYPKLSQALRLLLEPGELAPLYNVVLPVKLEGVMAKLLREVNNPGGFSLVFQSGEGR